MVDATHSVAGPVSIALETTCRQGGVALGAGEQLVEVLPFDAARRATTQVVGHLDRLLARHSLAPADVQEIYISTGPGSFTGTRVGITVARTLAQAVELAHPGRQVRCVGVPTVRAVAAVAEPLDEVEHLAVVLDARGHQGYWVLFERRAGRLEQAGEPVLGSPAELLERTPRPLHLTGEGLGYHQLQGPGLTHLPQELWLPRVETIWALGRAMAQAGQTVDYLHLLPIYTGLPVAIPKGGQGTGG